MKREIIGILAMLASAAVLTGCAASQPETQSLQTEDAVVSQSIATDPAETEPVEIEPMETEPTELLPRTLENLAGQRACRM